MTAESSQLFHRVRYRVSNRNRSQLLAMATPMLFYKTFKHTDSRLEDMTAYLTEQLKDSTDFTVSMTVMRKGAPHELLKPWEDAEDSNINKTILAYYISMLSIINTEYNDDSSRHIMLNAYVERFSIQEVMDVLRCLLHSLSTGVIPSEWRVHFPTPELAQKKLRMDVDALLAIPENYTAYIEKTAEQVMASPKQVMPPAKPEAKQGSYHTLLKSWDAAENSNINKIIQYYYIFMLSIIKSKYNDDESRQAMMNVYIKRFSIQEVMDVMRCMNHALTTGVIPFEWRAYLSSPKIAKEKVLADINALLSIPENYTAYIEKTPPAKPEPEPKQEEKQAKPEPKPEAKPTPKPVRLRSFGYSIGLNDETSQRVLRKAVESAGLYNVLCKLEFLLRVWDKYPCMRHLKRDHAFVKGLLNEM